MLPSVMDTTMGSTMNIAAARPSETVAYTHQLYTSAKEKSRPGRQELTQAKDVNSELKAFRGQVWGGGK